jgi:hypothetical protein
MTGGLLREANLRDYVTRLVKGLLKDFRAPRPPRAYCRIFKLKQFLSLFR